MLSDTDILEAIRIGELGIDPQLNDLMRPAGITLHLGAEILIPIPGRIDIAQGQTPEYDRVVLDDEPFILKQKQFVLAHTLEKITVGLSLGFMIEARSTLARLGVSVVQSAMIVDTGIYQRPITLEIFNASPNEITLYHKMSVARAAVFRLSSAASRGYDDYSRYRDQKEGVGIPATHTLSSNG